MSDFFAYLTDIFEQFGSIRSRKMFGVQGIYFNDLMFAILDDEELFLKVDDESIAQFEQRGLARWSYKASDSQSKISYFAAPEEIYDDPDEAARWAWIAYDAALRAQQAKECKEQKKRVNKRQARRN